MLAQLANLLGLSLILATLNSEVVTGPDSSREYRTPTGKLVRLDLYQTSEGWYFQIVGIAEHDGMPPVTGRIDVDGSCFVELDVAGQTDAYVCGADGANLDNPLSMFLEASQMRFVATANGWAASDLVVLAQGLEAEGVEVYEDADDLVGVVLLAATPG